MVLFITIKATSHTPITLHVLITQTCVIFKDLMSDVRE